MYQRTDPNYDRLWKISELNVYVGKQGIKTEKHLCEKVVKQLTRSPVNNYYTIYCDNYFTTIQLFNDLYKEGIYAFVPIV